jgi:multidrug efflux pump subunit AcrB
MTITGENLIWLLVSAALLSSLVTLLVLALLSHFWITPRLERRLEQRMEEGADRLEERFRRRLIELLGGKSGEVIRTRARDLARTGMGLLSGRRPPDENDDI